MAVEAGKVRRKSLEERFWEKVRKTDGCWLWTAAKMPNGYGEFGVGRGRYKYAHRLAYELSVGGIPDGLDIDHLCRNRGCVNPSHLEAVTRRENLLRGAHPKMIARREGRCCRGHALPPDTGKRRRCLRCHRERMAA